MRRWEQQRICTFLTYLLILIPNTNCDVDSNDNVTRVTWKSIAPVVEDALLKSKELLLNGSLPTTTKLQKIFVWYASYGSNMDMQRFLCYIKGGKVAGMRKPCEGSRDKTRPESTKWVTAPYRMFFGRNRTKTWGPGGVAFMDLEKLKNPRAHIRLYKISLQQFNDVLKQENDRKHVMVSPLLSSTQLNTIIKNEGYKYIKDLKKGWYRTVLYLGQEHKIPILTFTCPPSKMEEFRSNKLPVCAPSKAYKDSMLKALVEEGKVPPKQAVAYIRDSYKKPLKAHNSSCSCW